jgi:hypothetical protein
VPPSLNDRSSHINGNSSPRYSSLSLWPSPTLQQIPNQKEYGGIKYDQDERFDRDSEAQVVNAGVGEDDRNQKVIVDDPLEEQGDMGRLVPFPPADDEDGRNDGHKKKDAVDIFEEQRIEVPKKSEGGGQEPAFA